ncbi:hypothetical protein LF1_22640 [Rubripirellula obstinata]|uniref:Uncharacterized protein n=1 Tax=Rubripirellula obstinata TaxID=406547 RepID=A0A5B1CEY8_9BACT|nr:hypothetical protein [Rubripirellula obstinata]KAA1259727.1 hypothetical protein LF1_22640 [Rubripirellula obstinata]
MTDRVTALGFVVIAFLTESLTATSADLVHFDLPPTAAAVSDVDPAEVTISLRLSSMIQSPSMPRIDQWIVTCRPRGEGVTVVDYFPRTETGSDVSTPIQIKRSKEKSQSVGVHLDGTYPHIAGGTAAADRGEKNLESVQFDRTAPVQAVSAAGTIDRGRGVYFKLRWTATQVLEGEKLFQVTLRVPANWRGSLIDVSVRADRNEKKFGGLDQEIVTVGAANFVVATYRDGDLESQARAAELAEAEYELRNLAKTIDRQTSIRSLPQMLRHMVAKFDGDSKATDTHWVGRLISGRADPHLDKSINRLPMSLRVAALDYADCRDTFAELSRSHANAPDSNLDKNLDTRDQVLVAKPTLQTR